MVKLIDALSIKNSRLVLCPNCDSEFKIALADEDCICDDCGEEFAIMEEGYPEEFIWHPGKLY